MMKIYSHEYYNNTPSSGFRAVLESFLDCALWASGEPNEDGDVIYMDDLHHTGELTNESLAYVIQSITDFIASIDSLDLEAFLDQYDYSDLGHNFYLTSCGHGTGFWDRSYKDGELGDRLTELCEGYSFDCISVNVDSFEIT